MANKYKAKPCKVGMIRYASQKEARICESLKLLEKGGEIHSLELQPKYPIWINGIKCFTYIADAKYIGKDDKLIVLDVKGVRTPMYRLKRKSVEAYYGIKITEV